LRYLTYGVMISSMALELTLKKRLASWVFPHYSATLDKLNWNARLVAVLREARDVPILAGVEALHEFVHQRFAGVPIEYFKFGVYRGHSLRRWTGLNRHAESRFFGFDSFKGLPEDWTARKPKGTFDAGGQLPDIEDPRVQFVVGLFQQTLPKFLSQYRPRACPLIIHNDCDLFSSTLFCLTAMNGIIRPGTVIIFDEFYAVLHEFRALASYSSACMRTYRIMGATRNFIQAAIEITRSAAEQPRTSMRSGVGSNAHVSYEASWPVR